jgi:hypothetical protein
MNAIQKAAFAASSLAITLVGAALVTAPMAFARALPVVASGNCAAASLQVTQTRQTGCDALSRHSALIALNRS